MLVSLKMRAYRSEIGSIALIIISLTRAVWVAEDTRVRLPLEIRDPLLTRSEPVIFSGPSNVTPELLFMIRLLIVLPENKPALITCAEAPFNSTIPLVTVNIPSFVIVPDIWMVLPEIVREEPASIIRFLTLPVEPELKTGLFATLGI